MPLFECAICEVVENTALCEYWIQQKECFEEHGSLEDFEGICSSCRVGLWHGEFPRRTVSQAGLIDDGNGYLIDDPKLKDAKERFRELIADCCPSEQARIIAGCRDGYFSPPAQHEGNAFSAPSYTPAPSGKKRRRKSA